MVDLVQTNIFVYFSQALERRMVIFFFSFYKKRIVMAPMQGTTAWDISVCTASGRGRDLMMQNII